MQLVVSSSRSGIWRPISFFSKRLQPSEVKYSITSDIRHIKGKDNPVADALSRLEINAVYTLPPIDFTLLAEAQQNDPEMVSLKSSSSLCL